MVRPTGVRLRLRGRGGGAAALKPERARAELACGRQRGALNGELFSHPVLVGGARWRLQGNPAATARADRRTRGLSARRALALSVYGYSVDLTNCCGRSDWRRLPSAAHGSRGPIGGGCAKDDPPCIIVGSTAQRACANCTQQLVSVCAARACWFGAARPTPPPPGCSTAPPNHEERIRELNGRDVSGTVDRSAFGATATGAQRVSSSLP